MARLQPPFRRERKLQAYFALPMQVIYGHIENSITDKMCLKEYVQKMLCIKGNKYIVFFLLGDYIF
jgi:hypothetical protein